MAVSDMLSPWHKLIIGRASRDRKETRWMIRVARRALREAAAEKPYHYSHVRSWRLSALEVVIVRTCYAPMLVPVAAFVCAGYLAVVVYLLFLRVS